MNAPDKLFLHPNYKGDIGASWLNFPITNEDVTYIRKDALLEWAKERQAFYRKKADDIKDGSNPDGPFFYGKEGAFKELIGKIESL